MLSSIKVPETMSPTGIFRLKGYPESAFSCLLAQMRLGGSHRGNISDEGICDVELSIYASDDGEYNNLSGTFYVLPGQGMSTSGDVSEGIKMSTELKDEVTLMENGKSQTQQSQVSISFGIMYEPVKITVYQMDDAHQIIMQQEYKPGELPETLLPEENTAYIITETQKKRCPVKSLYPDRYIIGTMRVRKV